MAQNYKHNVEHLDDSQIKVTVTATPTLYRDHYEQAYSALSKDVKIPGFRAGKAPRPQIEGKIANDVFSEAVKSLLTSVASEIVDSEKLNPITSLKYEVLKVSDADGIEFTFEFTEYPQVKLGDLSKLEYEIESVEIGEKEVDAVLKNMFSDQKAEQPTEVDITKITDAQVKELGIDKIETLADLRREIESRLKEIKSADSQDKALAELVDKAIEMSKIPVPQALLSDATEKLVNEYVSRIQQLKVDIEQFLKAQGKDMDKLRSEKTEEAKKQIQREILYSEVVKHYQIIPEANEVENELKSITDPEARQRYETYEGRRYILSILIQRRALDKIREVAKPKAAAKPKAEKVKETPAKKQK